MCILEIYLTNSSLKTRQLENFHLAGATVQADHRGLNTRIICFLMKVKKSEVQTIYLLFHHFCDKELILIYKNICSV